MSKETNLKNKGVFISKALLIIVAISVFIAVIIVAENPEKRCADSRNKQREADVDAIMSAVYQYAVDNNGNVPVTILTSSANICATAGSCSGLVDLSVLIANGKYLASIPKDPNGSTFNDSGYQIVKSANGRITVSAPHAEQSATIRLTR